MRWTGLFIKNIITFLLVILLFVNILFTFDLVGVQGVVTGHSFPSGFFNDKYFGITTFIDAFNLHFKNNDIIDEWRNELQVLADTMDKVSFTKFAEYALGGKDIADLVPQVLNEFGIIGSLVEGITIISNLLMNIPYFILAGCYFLSFLLYIVNIAIQFVLFILSFVGGSYYSTLCGTYEEGGIAMDITPYIMGAMSKLVYA